LKTAIADRVMLWLIALEHFFYGLPSSSRKTQKKSFDHMQVVVIHVRYGA
jgi:hypothetical protein